MFFLPQQTTVDNLNASFFTLNTKNSKIDKMAASNNGGNGGRGNIRVTSAEDVNDSDVLNVIFEVMMRLATSNEREVLILTERQLQIYNEFMEKFNRSQGAPQPPNSDNWSNCHLIDCNLRWISRIKSTSSSEHSTLVSIFFLRINA